MTRGERRGRREKKDEEKRGIVVAKGIATPPPQQQVRVEELLDPKACNNGRRGIERNRFIPAHPDRRKSIQRRVRSTGKSLHRDYSSFCPLLIFLVFPCRINIVGHEFMKVGKCISLYYFGTNDACS